MKGCDLPRGKKIPTPVEWIRRSKDENRLKDDIADRVSYHSSKDKGCIKKDDEYLEMALKDIAKEYLPLYNEVCNVLNKMLLQEHPSRRDFEWYKERTGYTLWR